MKKPRDIPEDFRFSLERIGHPTPERLKAVLKVYGLTRKQAAEMLHVTPHGINGWCLPEGSRGNREMPLAYWELLHRKITEL